jgi:rod shape-determining protein MreD
MTDATRTFFQVLNDAVRVAAVYVVLILLTLILMANWALPYFSVLKPQIVLVVVFYWTLYRPTLMPPWMIFVVGLFLDAATPGVPMGTHACSYLLIAGLLKPRRRMLMGQPFMMIWAVFIAAMVVDLLIKCLAILAMGAGGLNVVTIVINALSTVLAFPVLLLFLVSVHRLLPPSRGMIST